MPAENTTFKKAVFGFGLGSNSLTPCSRGCKERGWLTGFATYCSCFLQVDFPCGSDGKSICLQCGRPRFESCIRKIPWRRKWQLTPVLLPGKSRGQRSLVGYSPWGHKELDMTAWLHFHFMFLIGSHSCRTLSSVGSKSYLIRGGMRREVVHSIHHIRLLFSTSWIPTDFLRFM